MQSAFFKGWINNQIIKGDMSDKRSSETEARLSVRWFAEQMEKKLIENDHKPDWKDSHLFDLMTGLADEAQELNGALRDFFIYGIATLEEIIKECAEVGNFAMMIADNAKRMQNKIPKESPTPGKDLINHPQHYTSHKSGIECIEVTEHFNFCLGNAIKYIWRAESKGKKQENLEKAIWYLRREIKKEEQ